MKCDDAIRMGLNMMSEEYGIDASAVIPKLMKMVYENRSAYFQELNHDEMEAFRVVLNAKKVEQQFEQEKLSPKKYEVKVIDEMALWHFTIEMKNKLALARANGKDGWYDKERCSDEHLAELFYKQLLKSDKDVFLDLANFLMFLHVRKADPKSLLFITDHVREQKNV